MTKLKGLWRKSRAFIRATSANVAMMFGLSLLPLAIAAGAGLDFAHAMMERSDMSDALDAAALAVGAKPGLSQSDATTLAQNVFNANFKGTGSPTITPVISGQSVSVTASEQVATTLLSVVGKPSINVTASSVVVWGQTKLWVGLVLDNTGSMCEPDSNPCPGDTSTSIKINALKAASHSLLGILQNAVTNAGDVQVAIVPFAKDVNVGMANVSATWIDWTDWEKSMPTSDKPGSSVGPGSNCPWASNGTYGGCLDQPGGTLQSNGVTMSTVSKVPSSGTYKGYICPDSINSSNSGQAGHFFNGCWTSLPTQTLTTTTINSSTPTTIKQNCTQTGSQTPVCTNTSSTQGSTTNPNTVTTATTSGYTGDTSTTTSSTVIGSNTDTNNSCNNATPKVCTWKRSYVSTALSGTVVGTGAAPFNHNWVVNSHSTWRGCVMDRDQNDDANDTTPGNKFPAENDDSCVVASAMTLNYTWDESTDTSPGKDHNLSDKIDSMVANGGTNQTIGLAHGMQMLTSGDPYNAPTLPVNTTRYIILLSDGLNTMNRWSGNGSAQSSAVDARMTAACTNAQAQGFIIYTVFLDLNGTQGNSAVLKACASDNTKYYDLTTTASVVTTFNQIAQQITNLRVSH